MREKSRIKRMFVLDGGSFLYGTGLMVFGREGEGPQRIFTPFYAFDTEEGWILFDTGWPPEAVPILEQMGMEPRIGEENSARGQLARIGVSPSSVSRIVLSHLHADHAGGLRFFPEAEVHVQKDELAYARHPNSFQALAYAQETFDMPHVRWNLMEGDGVIVPGLTAILSSGHTPGLQALLVELPESGFVLLCADACYLRENLEKAVPSGNAWNPVLGQYALKRFLVLRAILDCRCFPGHEKAFFDQEVRPGQAYS